VDGLNLSALPDLPQRARGGRWRRWCGRAGGRSAATICPRMRQRRVTMR